MKRAAPWDEAYTISSDDSSGSDSDSDDPLSKKKDSAKNGGSRSSKGHMSEGVLIRRAKMYQEYMKSIPIPNRRGSLIPFTSWQGLAASLKLLYHQPLHYLTNSLLRQWDRARIGKINSRKKKGGMSYEALSKHGYHGGPSILKVPPPRVEGKGPDWAWSKGTRESNEEAKDESYEERERTRAASQGEKLLNEQTAFQSGKKEKSASFSQKEKRKRDIGQASRGKNYVEEEKRLLRESGIYSGFDS